MFFNEENCLHFCNRTTFLEKKEKTDCFLTGKIANFRGTLIHIFGKGKWLNAEEAFVTTTPLLTCLIPLFSLYFSISKHCGHY
jgi:hypothetical protein